MPCATPLSVNMILLVAEAVLQAAPELSHCRGLCSVRVDYSDELPFRFKCSQGYKLMVPWFV